MQLTPATHQFASQFVRNGIMTSHDFQRSNTQNFVERKIYQVRSIP